MKAAKPFLKVQGGIRDYQGWVNTQPPGTGTAEYLKAIDDEISKHPGSVILCNLANSEGILKFLQSRDNFGVTVVHAGQTVEFVDKNISEISVENTKTISLKRCRIETLFLRASNRVVRLSQCDIGRLVLGSTSNAFEMDGGSIEHIQFETANPPFVGPVQINGVDLPEADDQVQSLRRLRNELLKIHNPIAASFVRAAELRIDRRTAAWPVRAVSWVYDFMSSYGTSALQPLALFTGLTVANVALLFWPVNTQTVGELRGWQSTLDGASLWAGFSRAVVLTFSEIFNPLGIFNRAPLIIATGPWLALGSTAICLLATAALAFFFLAVRRHVKLDA